MAIDLIIKMQPIDGDIGLWEGILKVSVVFQEKVLTASFSNFGFDKDFSCKSGCQS